MLTVLPDSVRNYMTKFVDPLWMRENGFVEQDAGATSRWATSSARCRAGT